jgi:tetratricopeptide (TPR) repeat protein
MQFSDLKKEFERIQSLLKSGTSKVDAKEYKDACEDLEECLALLEKGHPEDHPDRVSCLNALGETYFALRRYEQAFKVYKTLLKLNEDHPDNSSDELVIRFKLAKSAEHTRSIEEAIRAYEELTELAEASLPEGHPFISNILEGGRTKKKARGITPLSAVQTNSPCWTWKIQYFF